MKIIVKAHIFLKPIKNKQLHPKAKKSLFLFQNFNL